MRVSFVPLRLVTGCHQSSYRLVRSWLCRLILAVGLLAAGVVQGQYLPTDTSDRVHIFASGAMMSRPLPDGNDIGVCSGGIYVWQRRASDNAFLEFRARDAVIFYVQGKMTADPNAAVLGQVVTGVYFEGHVTFQVDRGRPGEEVKITAERLYYDFVGHQSLVLDADMRLRMPDTGLPIHIQAQQVRQLSQTHFAAQKLQVSNDEFHKPHVGMAAQEGELFLPDPNQSGAPQFTYEVRNVVANVESVPVFWWPKLRGTAQNAGGPLKNLRLGHDSHDGVSVESEWYLDSLLGLKNPAGVDSSAHLDEYTKRGPGGGVDVDYDDPKEQAYHGRLLTYLIDDHGQDRLGRFDPLRDVDPPHNRRGRADWQHRQLLPYNWEAIFEVSYVSDPDFLESWYEREFDTDKPQETLMYFKQQRNNWAFDFLNKFQLNDFEYTTTELPTAGFHIAGQDLFKLFTYYHDGYVSRLSEKAGDREVAGWKQVEDGQKRLWLVPGRESWILPDRLDEGDYAFAVSRHEIGLPLNLDGLRVVPTTIGTYVYDDTGAKSSYLQGAAGVRTSYQLWHVDNSPRSRLFDVDRVRHVVIPESSFFWVDGDDERDPDIGQPGHEFDHVRPSTTSQRILNLGVRQKWQTMRGPVGQKASVDFLRWDNSVTLVNHDADGEETVLPNRFFFSNPEPLFGKDPILNADFANLGLAHRERLNQTLADFVKSDWAWLVSQTTAVTGGVNVNTHEGVLSQADAGIAVQRTPRLGYYVGHRFLHNGDPFDEGRRVQIFDPDTQIPPLRYRNSNYLMLGLNYQINPKYSMVMIQHYDIERTTAANSEVVLLRKFVHWYGGFSMGYDPSRGSTSFMVSFWPEGFNNFSLGPRRFSKMVP